MITLYIIISLFIYPLSSPDSSDPVIQNEDYYLEKGLQEKKEGKFAEALKTWEEARVALPTPSLAVAIEHIQLSTEQELTDAYHISSAMYFWALSASESAELDSEIIRLELDMLEPILSAGTFKEMRKAFQDTPNKALPLIQQFWASVDPTPNTPYNERLIEHWERIAFARRTYKITRSSIYNTDDRGNTYVAYGEPNFVRRGEFNLSSYNVRNLVLSRIQMLDPASRAELVPDSLDAGARLDEVYAERMEDRIFEFAGSRRYEVWVYTTHGLERKANNVFIFGDTAIKGYAEATTIDDFIPSSAFTLSKRFAISELEVDFGITPAVIIQHEYLKEFSTIDHLFANAYSRIIDNFFRTGEPPRKSQAFLYKSDHIQTVRQIKSIAPKEVSTYGNDFPTIPVSAHPYRFIDENNRPYSIVYMESYPQGSFVIDSGRNAESMFKNPLDSALNVFSYYSFTHGAQIRDENWKLLDTQKDFPDIIVDPYVQSPASESVFILPHIGEEAVQVLYAELKNKHPETEPYIDSPFPKSLRGIGSVRQKQGKPLRLDESRLEMSDIIFGHDFEEGTEGVLVPFTPLHNKEVPLGDNLALHYQVYHLEQGLDDISRFEIEFEITKKQKFLDILRKDPPRYSLTLNQQTDKNYFRENLEVETNNLEKGNYTLRLTIKDTIRNQTVERKIDFKVIDPKPEY